MLFILTADAYTAVIIVSVWNFRCLSENECERDRMVSTSVKTMFQNTQKHN